MKRSSAFLFPIAKQFSSCLIPVLLLCSCGSNPDKPAVTTDVVPAIPSLGYQVVKTFPHDTTLFTEGFTVHDGQLYESTGSPQELPQTRSMVGPIDTLTGKMQNKIELDKNTYFGEGIVFLKGKLFELTYKNHVCFVYDAKTFKPAGQFNFDNNEGWSLTTDDSVLIMDDGTDKLTFIDPTTYKPIKKLQVIQNGVPRDSLNELEYIKGYIYANIWQNNTIVKIDPATGKVVGTLDLGNLVFDARNKYSTAEVLNGIAYDKANDKIYVTGKLWPTIYEIYFPH
jgi:glutaminyl-peptide cyclotransferase